MGGVRSSAKTSSEKQSHHGRIFLACVCCQRRKIKCDGLTPKCSNCKVRDLDCDYQAFRKTRGPAKRSKRDVKSLEERLEKIESLLHKQESAHIEEPSDESQDEDDSHSPELGQSSSSTAINPTAIPSPGGRPQHLKNPFHPMPTTAINMHEFRKKVAGPPILNFTPLMPYPGARHLVETSFDELMAEYPVLERSYFLQLFDEQYASSISDPCGDPARWACVNIFSALSMRLKTAEGSESQLADIPKAYYRNALAVFPDLILTSPTLLAVQSLLLMAIYMKPTSDHQAFIMLTTTATRQLDILTISQDDTSYCAQVYQIARALNESLPLPVLGWTS